MFVKYPHAYASWSISLSMVTSQGGKRSGASWGSAVPARLHSSTEF